MSLFADSFVECTKARGLCSKFVVCVPRSFEYRPTATVTCGTRIIGNKIITASVLFRCGLLGNYCGVTHYPALHQQVSSRNVATLAVFTLKCSNVATLAVFMILVWVS